MELLKELFSSSAFIPHGHCYLWQPKLVSLHIVADILIAIAYYSISITILYFVKKRQDLSFKWIFLLFGTFIILCGTNHFMEVWTLWHPTYWLSGFLKALTAIASIYTAVTLVKLIPQTLVLPSPTQLATANQQLEIEINKGLRTAEELRSSRQMLQAIMDNIPQAIFWKDRNSVFLGSNHNFAKAAGFKNPEEIIGLTDYDLWKLEEAEFFRACDVRVMDNDAPEYHIIKPMLQADGKQSWLDTNKIPLHDPQGNVVGILGTFEDITDRKIAEQALQKAKEEIEFSYGLVRGVIEGTPEPIFVKDLQGRYLMINSAGAAVFNLPEGKIIGKDDTELLPIALAQPIVEIDKLVIKTGETQTVEEILPGKDTLRTYLSTKSLCHDPKGNVIGIIGVARDITERKQTEAALRASEAEMRALFAAMNDVILVLDAEGRYLKIAPTNPNLLYKPQVDLIGKTITEVLPLAAAKFFLGYIQQALNTKQPVTLEYSMPIADSEVWFAACVSPMQDDSVIWVARDITERKQVETELKRSKEELEVRVETRTLTLKKVIERLQNEVAERATAEGARRDSEGRLQAILDHAPAVIYVKDTQGKYLVVNRQWETLFKFDLETFKGKSDYDIFPKELADAFSANDRKVIQSRKALELEELAPHDDGIHTYISLKFPLYNSKGEIYGLCGISTDITERKQVESALRLSEAQFRELATRQELINRLASQIRSSLDIKTILQTVVEQISNLWQLDRCLYISYEPNTNPPVWNIVQEVKNADLPSFLGTSIPIADLGTLTEKAFTKQIVRVADTQNLAEPLEREFFISTGYSAILTMPIHTQSGEIGLISCAHTNKPRVWTDSEVELLQAVADQVAIAIDQAQLYKQSHLAAATAKEKATQLELTLQELQQTQSQLIQTEKMSSLGQLVAGVAHEINNPVNFIYGNITHTDRYTKDLLELLELYRQHYPQPSTEIQAYAEDIDLDFLIVDLPKILSSMKMGAERIRNIVLSLRNFSRLDEAEMKAVDIHEGLDSTLLILQNRLKAKPEHAAIQIIKEYAKLPLVNCYAGQLNQVFMNILNNAIDALDEHNTKRSSQDIQAHPSTIKIHTQILDSNYLSISIADNGTGMTEKVRQRVFDPFFTTKPIGSGTGLGMSISYQIIAKHHGKLSCISSPGNGAEFLIELPLKNS